MQIDVDHEHVGVRIDNDHHGNYAAHTFARATSRTIQHGPWCSTPAKALAAIGVAVHGDDEQPPHYIGVIPPTDWKRLPEHGTAVIRRLVKNMNGWNAGRHKTDPARIPESAMVSDFADITYLDLSYILSDLDDARDMAMRDAAKLLEEHGHTSAAECVRVKFNLRAE